jgi:hypothetical protein
MINARRAHFGAARDQMLLANTRILFPAQDSSLHRISDLVDSGGFGNFACTLSQGTTSINKPLGSMLKGNS